ncbi:hypothetical protein ABZZ80_19255 [Streptomyces sp. NPDC006356]
MDIDTVDNGDHGFPTQFSSSPSGFAARGFDSVSVWESAVHGVL